MVHGWCEIEGVTYYFDDILGILYPEWRKENENIYYLVDGEKYEGEKSIGGHWYYFDPQNGGAMVKGTWCTHHEKTYYYDEKGRMVHGWYKIGEIEYYFEKITGVNVSGFVKEDGNTYFYLESGERYIGEKKIDGNWYYFDPAVDGKMKTGWHNFPNKRVYYNSDGTMVHGEKAINGKWYYFDAGTGAMETGWHNFPNKRVYYGSDGAMVYGTQVIGGITYYFDPTTGALITNAMTTKAQAYSSATGWLLMVDTRLNKVGVYQGRYKNWRQVCYWSCTSGAASTPTVKGQFTVGSKGLAFGSGYTCWYYTQFYGDYLFHSILYNPGSMTSVQDGRLGINASHGCIRLAIQNAKWIYDNIPVGTKVVVY